MHALERLGSVARAPGAGPARPSGWIPPPKVLVPVLPGDTAEPWHCPEELVPLNLVDQVARPDGLVWPGQAPGDCPTVPELLRPIG